MKTCASCDNNISDYQDKPYCFVYQTSTEGLSPCDSYIPKPPTNYDRIIIKTPEELSLWLSDIAEWLPHYAGKAHAILKLLEQEDAK